MSGRDFVVRVCALGAPHRCTHAEPSSAYAVTVPVDPTRRLVSVTFANTDPSVRMFDLQTAAPGNK
jgi:hypothetical protein